MSLNASIAVQERMDGFELIAHQRGLDQGGQLPAIVIDETLPVGEQLGEMTPAVSASWKVTARRSAVSTMSVWRESEKAWPITRCEQPSRTARR